MFWLAFQLISLLPFVFLHPSPTRWTSRVTGAPWAEASTSITGILIHEQHAVHAIRTVGIDIGKRPRSAFESASGQTLRSGVPRSASALPGSSPKADIPLMMSWTALHPTCGNHRGLSGKES